MLTARTAVFARGGSAVIAAIAVIFREAITTGATFGSLLPLADGGIGAGGVIGRASKVQNRIAG